MHSEFCIKKGRLPAPLVILAFQPPHSARVACRCIPTCYTSYLQTVPLPSISSNDYRRTLHEKSAATRRLAAVIVTAAAAAVVLYQTVVAAAAEQDQKDDDPPATVTAKTAVITHKNYLRG